MPDTGTFLYVALVIGVIALLAWADRRRSMREKNKR